MAISTDHCAGQRQQVFSPSIFSAGNSGSWTIIMGLDTVVAIVSMALALLALAAAIAQVNIQASIEARRKGKTDKLALGDWAMTWPQLRLAVFHIFSFFFLTSPFGDPRILTVPFITIGALEDCLRNESQATGRQTLQRRMTSRLVESASQSIATGAGRFTGRMYAVRGTTRKRSEACWSDAMDMCGITRRFWPLLTSASAQACDGAIRPANAVTNLHSLLGFARAMGLRQIERQGTRITMTNGGASIYLDQYAGVDRPTRLAHFSGSPNGRYTIIEEMSQQTAASIYTDAVWADGCIPVTSRLNSFAPGKSKSQETGKRRVLWPSQLNASNVPRGHTPSQNLPEAFAPACMSSITVTERPPPSYVPMIQVIQSREAAIVSCIRTYPKGALTSSQMAACNQALLWCLQHWWLDAYQQDHMKYPVAVYETPRIPLPDVSTISCEFVTDFAQAMSWHRAANSRESIAVDPSCWNSCVEHAQNLVESLPLLSSRPALSLQAPAPSPMSNPHSSGFAPPPAIPSPSPAQTPQLAFHDHSVLIKILQGWKLNVLCAWCEAAKEPTDGDSDDVSVCLVALLTMATLAIAMDSSQIGSNEANKALEIELG